MDWISVVSLTLATISIILAVPSILFAWLGRRDRKRAALPNIDTYILKPPVASSSFLDFEIVNNDRGWDWQVIRIERMKPDKSCVDQCLLAPIEEDVAEKHINWRIPYNFEESVRYGHLLVCNAGDGGWVTFVLQRPSRRKEEMEEGQVTVRYPHKS